MVSDYTNGADAAAAYWKSPVSRAEVQEQFDKLKPVIVEIVSAIHGNDGSGGFPAQQGLVSIVAEIMLRVAFVMEKTTSAEEYEAWKNKKVEESNAASVRENEAPQS